MKKVFITGGAGYVGSELSKYLIEEGYVVTVFDLFIYGQTLKSNPKLKLIKGDIRDQIALKKSIPGHDIVIHLACISNDASFVLDEELSTSINLDAFEPMVIAAKEAKIKRFIYASTSSVYGVSDKPDVKEDHPLSLIHI